MSLHIQYIISYLFDSAQACWFFSPGFYVKLDPLAQLYNGNVVVCRISKVRMNKGTPEGNDVSVAGSIIIGNESVSGRQLKSSVHERVVSFSNFRCNASVANTVCHNFSRIPCIDFWHLIIFHHSTYWSVGPASYLPIKIQCAADMTTRSVIFVKTQFGGASSESSKPQTL